MWHGGPAASAREPGAAVGWRGVTGRPWAAIALLPAAAHRAERAAAAA